MRVGKINKCVEEYWRGGVRFRLTPTATMKRGWGMRPAGGERPIRTHNAAIHPPLYLRNERSSLGVKNHSQTPRKVAHPHMIHTGFLTGAGPGGRTVISGFRDESGGEQEEESCSVCEGSMKSFLRVASETREVGSASDTSQVMVLYFIQLPLPSLSIHDEKVKHIEPKKRDHVYHFDFANFQIPSDLSSEP